MKYKFDKFTYSDGDQDLIIIMEDEKYRLTAQFLMSDIQGADPAYALETIDKVISGESKYEELNGNVCGLEIYKERTKIYDNLADDGMGDWCEVDTKELRELIEIWSREVRKFRGNA